MGWKYDYDKYKSIQLLSLKPIVGGAMGEGVLETVVHSALAAEGFIDSGMATEEEAAKAVLKWFPTQLFGLGLKRFEE